jgi:arabinose-5-phosphate isomerase
MVGRPGSTLGQESDVVIDTSVEEEACPHDLAPTTSTTVTLVLGDALAIALLHLRQFGKEDFAMFHPAGALGRRLLLKVDELMIAGDAIPRVQADTPLRDAIVEMTTKRLGCTCVLGPEGTLAGIITDGDLRRLLQRTTDISGITAENAMTRNPKTTRTGTLAAAALEQMESFKITQIIVVNADRTPAGVVHLHDLVNAGLSGNDAA